MEVELFSVPTTSCSAYLGFDFQHCLGNGELIGRGVLHNTAKHIRACCDSVQEQTSAHLDTYWQSKLPIKKYIFWPVS